MPPVLPPVRKAKDMEKPHKRPPNNTFKLTSKEGDGSYQEFLNNEARYTRLVKPFPERAEKLFSESEKAAKERFEHLQRLVELYK